MRRYNEAMKGDFGAAVLDVRHNRPYFTPRRAGRTGLSRLAQEEEAEAELHMRERKDLHRYNMEEFEDVWAKSEFELGDMFRSDKPGGLVRRCRLTSG